METVPVINAKLEWTHVGQYHAYGDTFRECEIHTPDTLTEEDILFLVQETHKLPKQLWEIKSKDDIYVYFTGWYTITKTPYGYKYVACEPYTD